MTDEQIQNELDKLRPVFASAKALHGLVERMVFLIKAGGEIPELGITITAGQRSTIVSRYETLKAALKTAVANL